MINNKENVPLEHYREVFRNLDTEEVTQRTQVAFDGNAFTLNLLSYPIKVTWPEFSLTVDAPDHPKALETAAVQILVIRYLIEGSSAPALGKFLSYRELPWGDVYDKNFQGRCVLRLAYGFGSRLEAFDKACAKIGGVKLELDDVSYELPFFEDIKVRLILHQGDEEFPPSSQFLFSDNTPLAFTAEDMAAAGDLIINTLKEVSK